MAWPSSISSSPSPMKSCRTLTIFCCTTFLLSLLCLSNGAHADINGDARQLLAFKGNITNAGKSLQTWNELSIANICTAWKGVACSSDGQSTPIRVVELRLPGSSLSGSIPPDTIGHLDALQTLSLRRNRLSGSLPQDFTNLRALQRLILNGNSFSGPLLFNFSAWPLLRKLDLSSNNFSGEIPSSLSTLTKLDSLFLQDNNFSGSLPSSLGALPLRQFSVGNNRLNGSIPPTLSQFPAASFAGNLDLCGAPLTKCADIQPPTPAPAPTKSSISPTDSNNSSGSDDKKSNAATIAAIVIGAMAGLLALLCVLFLLFQRRKKKHAHAHDLYADGRAEFESKTKGGSYRDPRGESMKRKGSGKSGESETVKNNKSLIFMGDGQQTFDLDDLLRASAEVLGKGSLGTSYKAIIEDGQPYSVKRFREIATNCEDMGKHVEMLGALPHPHLVPLRAYYFAPKGKLLVSEFMPKGNLTTLLHGKKGAIKEVLSWETRLAIAAGVAKGVLFLHSKKIMHGDIKPNNVVMDADNQVRLTDYGLVQLMPRDLTSNLKPSPYTPPEARQDSKAATYKGDVYAFGVLLLELVAGLPPAGTGDKVDELVQWVQSHVPQHLESVLDPLLLANPDATLQDEMISLLNIALPCIAPSSHQRPHMVEVVSSIESLRKHDRPTATDFYFTQVV